MIPDSTLSDYWFASYRPASDVTLGSNQENVALQIRVCTLPRGGYLSQRDETWHDDRLAFPGENDTKFGAVGVSGAEWQGRARGAPNFSLKKKKKAAPRVGTCQDKGVNCNVTTLGKRKEELSTHKMMPEATL